MLRLCPPLHCAPSRIFLQWRANQHHPFPHVTPFDARSQLSNYCYSSPGTVCPLPPLAVPSVLFLPRPPPMFPTNPDQSTKQPYSIKKEQSMEVKRWSILLTCFDRGAGRGNCFCSCLDISLVALPGLLRLCMHIRQ